MEEHAVLIGASGWLHPKWEEEFYPDDLPQEWRLGFYGNEFPVVLVPASYWGMGKEAAEEWLEESDEAPRLICEWPASVKDSSEADHILEMIDILAARILGIVFIVDSDIDDATYEYFKVLAAKFPVSLDIRNGDCGALRERFAAVAGGQEVGVCWHGEEEQVDNLRQGKLVLTRINDKVLTPMELRRVLECCLASSKLDCCVVLIFEGAPPEMKQMVNAGVMLDLL